jgi:hypothetical protein
VPDRPATRDLRDGLVPAAVTTVGSMPGTDVRAAVKAVVDTCASGDGVPHLPELPARGPGADLVGRTTGLLAGVAPDFATETTTTGWRFADAPGRDARRARSWVGEDLDVFEEALQEFGGTVAVSLCGPWTLAASVELRGGERAVRDPGAGRDIAAALAALAVDHVGDLRRRLPGARISLWLDEPALPAVLHGEIPTSSGLGRIAAVDEPVAESGLRAVIESLHGIDVPVVVHCCGPRPPYALLRRAGVDAVSSDLLLHDRRDDDELGELMEADVALVLGVLPTGPPLSDVRASVDLVRDLGHRLGHGPEAIAAAVLVSPSCGLGASDPDHAHAVLRELPGLGRALRDEEGGRGRE